MVALGCPSPPQLKSLEKNENDYVCVTSHFHRGAQVFSSTTTAFSSTSAAQMSMFNNKIPFLFNSSYPEGKL